MSDAGTPLISDPGYKLVRAAVRGRPCTVTALPGASAVLGALGVAGLPTDRFFFEGFLPPKQAARQKRIAELAAIPGDAGAVRERAAAGRRRSPISPPGLGPRAAAICRELTKLHEEIRRGDLTSLARDYAAGRETRGEIVIVVAPPADDAAKADDVDDLLRRALARVSVKDAVGEVALATGRPRREVYQRALALAISRRKGQRRWRGVTPPPGAPKPAPRPERQKREARPEKIAAFGLGISAESRAAAWLIAHGYPHSGAALEKPARRDRYHRRPPPHVDFRRSESAREIGRCG